MFTCQRCQRPLTLREPRLCPVCDYPPSMEARAEYVAHDLLTAVQPYVEANHYAQVLKGWLAFQREVGQIAIAHAPTAAALGQRVKPEWDSQRKWRDAEKRYKKAVPLKEPAAEFCFMLALAADSRTHYLQRLRNPQTALELVSDTYAFERYNRVFVAGLRIIDPPAPQTKADFQETLRQAVKAMRREIFDGLGWQTGALQEHPLAEVREWGSILFAGVMHSMITMNFPGLRTALAQEGFPEEVLLKRLPPTGYMCWYDSSRESLEAVRNRVVNVLKQNDSQDSRQDHPARDDLDQVLRDTLSPTLNDVYQRLELEDFVKALCQEANLTTYQEQILCHQLQGDVDREIADKLQRQLNAVQQAWGDTRKKIRTIYSPEELKRLIH